MVLYHLNRNIHKWLHTCRRQKIDVKNPTGRNNLIKLRGKTSCTLRVYPKNIHVRPVVPQIQTHEFHTRGGCLWGEIHNKKDANHLKTSPEAKYRLTTEWTRKLYFVMTLEWKYTNRTVELPIIGYAKSPTQVPAPPTITTVKFPHWYVLTIYVQISTSSEPPDTSLPWSYKNRHSSNRKWEISYTIQVQPMQKCYQHLTHYHQKNN